MKNELWKSINGYDGLYEVSNLGNIRSIDRTIIQKNRWGNDNMRCHKKGKLIKKQKHRCGYLSVGLAKQGKVKTFLVHRLVAEAFIPNPDNKETVNHINENKKDNRVENLEWATLPENIKYGTGIRRCHTNRDYSWFHAHSRELSPSAKPVLQLSQNGNLIKEWNCISNAAKALNTSIQNISAAVTGKSKTACGYKWQYK